MSKETAAGIECIGCRVRITFMDYHLPHCQPARDRLAKLARKSAAKVEKAKAPMAKAA